jgi:hypothetical protein
VTAALRASLLASIVVLALCAPAHASELLTFSHGQLTAHQDAYLAPPTAADIANPAPPRVHAAQSGPSVQQVLDDAYLNGDIDQQRYESYSATYRDARSTKSAMKGACATQLGNVLATLGRIARAGALTPTRMPALFLQLSRNTQFWRASPTIGIGARVSFRGSRMIFQHYRGQGIQIQPLANLGRANGLYSACTGADSPPEKLCPRDSLRRILDEMLAVASLRGGALTWEYWFYFGGGTPPWTSGISQGTALQAYSRASTFYSAPSYLQVARSALALFNKPPPTGVRVRADAGNHYLLYSYAPRYRVLNAFLQALIGLYDYSTISGDQRGWSLFAAGDLAARREVPRYDTGRWSLYALPVREVSSSSYHQLVTGFLTRLCKRTHTGVYCTTAKRFGRYLRHPPPAQRGPPSKPTPPRRCGYV